MESEKFVSYRKQLGLTQKELAQLLVTSVKTIHSYEQGRRNIPDSIERQIYFLISGKNKPAVNSQPCWIIKKCPEEIKNQCPAWKFKNGQLCWFITGTFCEGQVNNNWKEKIKICKKCEVFKSILDL
ncbi:MAG: helix-turn-helix transcriptional regulator [Deltaproteobacteria bacterium]|nr:helix-turn-helix transcriptional regulator [Deltaproteobacteria bacterium]